MKKLLLALLLSTSSMAHGAIFGDGFGVNIKTERITPTELAEIKAMGIKRVRVGLSWYIVEQQRGVYRFDTSNARRSDADDYGARTTSTYDQIMGEIVSAGLIVDATLHEGNAGLLGLVNIAPAGQPAQWRHRAPQTDAEIAMFAAFTSATVRHYDGLYPNKFRWHIWNEPDTDSGYPPKTNAGTVGKLLLKSCEAIKRVSPRAKVMGPALGAYGDGFLRFDYLRGLFSQANPLTCLDGVTVHPYRSAVPEAAAADLARVASVMAPYQPQGKVVPVAIDEWGYSINVNTFPVPTQAWRDRSENEQAALMLRMYLTSLVANVPLTVIYDWRDNGTSPTDWEHHFGVKAYNGADKAAARMFRFVWPNLSGRPYSWLSNVPGCGAGSRLMRFAGRQGDGITWSLAYTYDNATRTNFSISGQVLAVKDIFGADVTPTTLGKYPVLVKHLSATKPVLKCGS